MFGFKKKKVVASKTSSTRASKDSTQPVKAAASKVAAKTSPANRSQNTIEVPNQSVHQQQKLADEIRDARSTLKYDKASALAVLRKWLNEDTIH